MDIPRLAAALILALASSSCASNEVHPEGGSYLPPAGNFRLELPTSIFEETRVFESYEPDEGYGWVTAHPDLGGWEKISYDLQEEELVSRVLSLDGTEAFHRFFSAYFEGDFVPRNYPTGEVVLLADPTFHPTPDGELLFAAFSIPEGSPVYNVGSGENLDLPVGVLIFIRGRHSYELHKAARFLADGYSLEELIEITLELYERIEFRD